MNRYDSLMSRIGAGEKILIDGATGTEIEKRGVPQLENAWNGGGARSHPDILRQVHVDYLKAGAEIVISNTFATHCHALMDAGVPEQFEMLNRRGVEIAIEAREQAEKPNALVAGGMSYWAWSDDWRAPESLRADAERQAQIMAEAGADLLVLEMMVDIDSMLVMLEAALAAKLPVWVGLSCNRDNDGQINLLRNDSLEDALLALADYDIPLISIMHTEVEDIDACLDVVDQRWDGPVCVYAHSARWSGQVGIFDNTIPAEEYANYCDTWLRRGVDVIGGCCGLGVAHIKALQPLIQSRT